MLRPQTAGVRPAPPSTRSPGRIQDIDQLTDGCLGYPRPQVGHQSGVRDTESLGAVSLTSSAMIPPPQPTSRPRSRGITGRQTRQSPPRHRSSNSRLMFNCLRRLGPRQCSFGQTGDEEGPSKHGLQLGAPRRKPAHLGRRLEVDAAQAFKCRISDSVPRNA